MSETWHEYDLPVDKSVHSDRLRHELREGANTSTETKVVTCPGCLDWIRRRVIHAVMDEIGKSLSAMELDPSRSSRRRPS